MSKMKKYRILSMLAAMILLVTMCPFMLSGCGGGAPDTGAEDEYAEDAGQDAVDDSSGDQTDDSGDWKNVTEDPEIDISALGGEGVDVDLTKLSSTMVYSVVNDMMIRPNDYVGKKVRMNGTMSAYHDEETGKTYYACIIRDATACCAQGIEFATTDDYSVADYPADGEPLTVVGTYDLYMDEGFQYCILKDAVFE